MTERSAKAVVIGASAGAIDALLAILPSLPKNYPLPIVVVVHLREDRESALVELFRRRCAMNVIEAEDKMPIEAGVVYFAPPDYHLLIEANQWLSLSVDEPVNYSRPSIDVMFQSAADAYRERLVGVVLTGANRDGAQGLRSILDAGAVALVEDPRFAYAPVMPQAASDACPEALQMRLQQIAMYLRDLGSSE